MKTVLPQTSYPAAGADSRWARYRARYREGLGVLLLVVAYVSVPGFAVQFGGWPDQYVPVGLTGFAGTVAGVLLAKSRLSDAVAHLLSVVLALLLATALLLLNAGQLGERVIDRVRPLLTVMVEWYLGRQDTNDQELMLVSLLLGLLVWMFAYLSTWTMFRRGWLAAGLLFPGALALVTLRYAPTPRAWTLVVMLALAIPIATRMSYSRREQRWARRRMASPVGLGGRFVIVGTVLGLLVSLAAAQTPQAWSRLTFDPLLRQIGTAYQRASDQASEWMGDRSGDAGPDLQNAGSYTAFDDAFSISGPLELSDRPEVFVQTTADRAPYLTAHTYDTYTGRGWASSTDEQFGDVETDQGRLSPELLFRAGQSVVLSGDVTGARVAQSTTVTPLAGPSGVVFSVDTYLSSDISTVVRMSWQRLDDAAYPVTVDTLNALPPDIQRLANLLLQAELSGSPSDWGPEATSPSMQQEIEAEVDALARRGILVRWDATPEGIVGALYVTGRLPVFDDVEAVYPRNVDDATAGSTYTVRSLSSAARPDQLATAPTEYPAWVTERYLSPGDSLTERTRELAVDIVGDAVDPYTQAGRIEAYLRENITYNERVAEPPANVDLVDYTLFDSKQGYCEHYSASMTVMMRSLGVPARTVVGYYPGDYDEARGGYVYRQLNAHAWTEVFFPGYGWIPFEPTASRSLDDRDASAVQEATEAPVPTEVIPTPDVSDANDAATPVPQERSIDNPGPPQPVIAEDPTRNGLPRWVLPVALAAASVVAVPALVWAGWSWRFRGMPPAAALFGRARVVGKLGGVRSGSTTTPREYAHRFSEQLPGMGPPVRRIVQVYETDQYGPAGADAGSLATAREAWRELRRSVVRLLVRRRRKA